MDWEAIEKVFSHAIELESDARANFLDSDFHADPEVREKVKQLVRSHIDAHTFWEEQSVDKNQVPEARLPDHIGGYHLEKEIGQGGMGRVFIASRTKQGVTQQVAIKILRKEAESVGLTRMFLNEFRILATLNHPGIVQLRDYGNEDGWFYIVMELVDGEPITTYCDRLMLSPEQRLILFTRVCDILSFAHFNLITHRDIKPDNILVTREGEVKLLDFGIARLQDSSMRTLKTTKLIFTPQYASPEQFQGMPITTSTDIYSVGVLLFQIIVGRLPYDQPSQDSAFLFGKRVCEQRPLSPVDVLQSVSKQELETISRNRSCQPGKLKSILQGDLLYIISKCLRKEAMDRYHSMEDLRKDIRNYLEKKRVTARKGTLGYTVRTFIKRNLLTSGISALFLAILIGMGFYQYISISRERDNALREWKKAEKTTQFLNKIFEQTNPDFTQRGDMKAIDVLNNGLRAVQSELDGLPDIKLSLYLQIAKIYRHIDGLQEAGELLNQAEVLAVQLHDHEVLSDVIHEKGMVFMGRKEFAEAEKAFRETIVVSHLPPGDLADVQIALGNALVRQGKYKEAELVSREIVLPSGEEMKNYKRKMAFNGLKGGLYFHLGDQEKSYRYYSAARDIANLHNMYHTLETATIISNLAGIDLRNQNVELAVSEKMESLSIMRSILPKESLQIGVGYTNLSVLLYSMGRTLQAQEYLLKGIAIKEKALGPDSGELQNDYIQLSFMFITYGDFEAAHWALSMAEYVQEKSFDILNPARINLSIGWHTLFRELGKTNWARETIACALDLGEEVYGVQGVRNALTHYKYGSLEASVKNYDAAISHFEKAIELMKQQPGQYQSRIEMLENEISRLDTLNHQNPYR